MERLVEGAIAAAIRFLDALTSPTLAMIARGQHRLGDFGNRASQLGRGLIWRWSVSAKASSAALLAVRPVRRGAGGSTVSVRRYLQ